jgi:hypothetical protein
LTWYWNPPLVSAMANIWQHGVYHCFNRTDNTENNSRWWIVNLIPIDILEIGLIANPTPQNQLTSCKLPSLITTTKIIPVGNAELNCSTMVLQLRQDFQHTPSHIGPMGLGCTQHLNPTTYQVQVLIPCGKIFGIIIQLSKVYKH